MFQLGTNVSWCCRLMLQQVGTLMSLSVAACECGGVGSMCRSACSLICRYDMICLTLQPLTNLRCLLRGGAALPRLSRIGWQVHRVSGGRVVFVRTRSWVCGWPYAADVERPPLCAALDCGRDTARGGPIVTLCCFWDVYALHGACLCGPRSARCVGGPIKLFAAHLPLRAACCLRGPGLGQRVGDPIKLFMGHPPLCGAGLFA